MEWHHAVLICIIILVGAYAFKQFGLLQFPQQTIVFNPMEHEHPEYVNQTWFSTIIDKLNASIQSYGVKVRIDIPLYPTGASQTAATNYETGMTLWNASEWDWSKIVAIYLEGAGFVSAGGSATVILKDYTNNVIIPNSNITWTETTLTVKRSRDIKEYMNFTGRINGRLEQVSGTFNARGFRLIVIVKIP